jgi:hypothetical protein
MFWYIFDGEAIAENGQLQLDDNKPGMGLSLKNDYLDQFKIVEHESSLQASVKM